MILANKTKHCAQPIQTMKESSNKMADCGVKYAEDAKEKHLRPS
jgi:hypothetical protein